MASVDIIGTRGYPSYYGGFETAVRMLAPYLVEHGWDVTVYSRRGATQPDDPKRDPRVRVRFTRGVNTRSLSTLTYGLSSAISAAWRRPQIALIMNVANSIWLPIYKLRRIPTVVNVDGIEWEREKWGALARAIFRLGAKATARWADELVFDAAAIGERWRSEFGRDGVVIPYGGAERDALPLPNTFESGKYVLVVCRFVPENTIEAFFDAVEEIAGQTQVVIVGSSGYGGRFDDRAKDLESRFTTVHWLGHVADDDLLHALWQHAGVYFHGHTVGGTNPALVQAMALGAPVLAVDTVFNRETLGPRAALTEPAARAIASNLLVLLEDDDRRAELSDEAIDRTRSHYSWATVNNRYLETLARLHRA